MFLGVGIAPLIQSAVIEKSTIPFSNGNTLFVGGSGPGNYTRIQDAINDANDGYTVFVYNGTYYENVWVGKSISLIGEDKYTTIIDGQNIPNNNTVLIFADNVILKGFTTRQ